MKRLQRGPRQQSQVGYNETRYEYIECHGRFSLSLFFSYSHGPTILYRLFYRLWHSMSHGVVMASPQKHSFNNLTVSPMYTITGVRIAWGGREIEPRSVHHRNARQRQCSHNEQILWTRDLGKERGMTFFNFRPDKDISRKLFAKKLHGIPINAVDSDIRDRESSNGSLLSHMHASK